MDGQLTDFVKRRLRGRFLGKGNCQMLITVLLTRAQFRWAMTSNLLNSAYQVRAGISPRESVSCVTSF